MKILVTGSHGLVGQKTVELFARCRTYTLILTSRQEQSIFDEPNLVYRQMDITNKKSIRTVLDELEPEIIINAAAYVDVDACEHDRATAWQVNASGVENLVHASKLIGAKIIQVSTDYIFDGKNGPYDEQERPSPINYYGKTKLAAENILRTSGISYAILRTLFLYGAGFQTKANFPDKVLKALESGEQVKAPDDQFSNPTLADDVAYAILKVVELNRSGVYNIGGPVWMSRFEFAKKIASAFGHDKRKIIPVKMASMKQIAQRPLKSGFVTLKAEFDLGLKTTPIEQGLLMYKSQLQQYKEFAGEGVSQR